MVCRRRLAAPAAAVAAQLVLCWALVRERGAAFADRQALAAASAQWRRLLNENHALDGALSAQCRSHPGSRCAGGRDPWGDESVRILDGAISSSSRALGAGAAGAPGRRLAQSDGLDEAGREVWDALAPVLSEAAAWRAAKLTNASHTLRGFSFLDSSADDRIAEAVAMRYAPLATVVSVGSIANRSDTKADRLAFPTVLYCGESPTARTVRGLFMSNEFFALHYAGEWPPPEMPAREGTASAPGEDAVQGLAEAGPTTPSLGQRLALAMDTFVRIPAGRLGEEEDVRHRLQALALEAGAVVTVSLAQTAANGLLAHVHVERLERRIQHHFIDPASAQTPAEARLVRNQYTMLYDPARTSSRTVTLTRLMDKVSSIRRPPIRFFGGNSVAVPFVFRRFGLRLRAELRTGRGVTVQCLAALGLGRAQKSALFSSVLSMPLFEDMAPWNLMAAQGRLEYVDSENAERTLDALLPTLGALSLFFGRVEEMARQLTLCREGAGNTLYGRSIPFVAACQDGDFSDERPFPCGHDLTQGVACRSGRCSSSFVDCMRGAVGA